MSIETWKPTHAGWDCDKLVGLTGALYSMVLCSTETLAPLLMC